MNDVPYMQIIAVAAVFAIWGLFRLRRLGTAKKIRAALAAGAKVIDVRSPQEFAGGHFQGAVNIPHDKLQGKLKAVGGLDEQIVVYCASGARSAAAERTLKAAGYRNVLNAGPLSAMPG